MIFKLFICTRCAGQRNTREDFVFKMFFEAFNENDSELLSWNSSLHVFYNLTYKCAHPALVCAWRHFTTFKYLPTCTLNMRRHTVYTIKSPSISASHVNRPSLLRFNSLNFTVTNTPPSMAYRCTYCTCPQHCCQPPSSMLHHRKGIKVLL